MGRATKRKQEAQLARQPDFNGLLLNAKKTEAKKQADIISFDPMVLIQGYENQAIRALDDFEPHTRSRISSRPRVEVFRDRVWGSKSSSARIA